MTRRSASPTDSPSALSPPTAVKLRGSHSVSMADQDADPAASTHKVAVLGCGSYGTAMAVVAARSGHAVSMFTRHRDQASSINERHRNSKRFATYELSPLITATTDFEEAVADASVIVHAIPAQHTPSFVERYRALFPSGVPVVSTAKGICVATHELMSGTSRCAWVFMA